MTTIVHIHKLGKSLISVPLDSKEGQAAIDSVRSLPLIGAYNNNWRQRKVEVYQHSTDESLVVSIGYGKGEAMGNIYVCEEQRSAYQGRIDNNDWRDYN